MVDALVGDPVNPELLDLPADYTVYDAAYVVLAQALAAPLVTADAKLLEARKVGVDARILAPLR